MLHRDIKPDNLLLVGGHVKVADYGLARLLEATGLHTASRVGTPLYMAPEVWQNKVNFTADQYALACTYAELRTGHHPFPGDHPAAVMYAHLTREPEADVPEEERQVLLRALAKDAAERFPTCVAFVQALTAAVRQPAVHAVEQGGEKGRPIAPSPSHLSGSLQPVDAAPRDTRAYRRAGGAGNRSRLLEAHDLDAAPSPLPAARSSWACWPSPRSAYSCGAPGRQPRRKRRAWLRMTGEARTRPRSRRRRTNG